MTDPKMSEEKMMGHLENLGEKGVSCKENPCRFCQAIRSAIEERGRMRERKLTRKQADEIEAKTRRLEADPSIDKHAFRLYLESPMPCGHPVANLLMCEDPPYGCVVCGPPDEGDFKLDGEEEAPPVQDTFHSAIEKIGRLRKEIGEWQEQAGKYIWENKALISNQEVWSGGKDLCVFLKEFRDFKLDGEKEK